MFKKIEIWILYLVIIFSFISHIIFGALVRREALQGSHIPVISPISKVALFLSKIPSNVSKISNLRNPFLIEDINGSKDWKDNFKLNPKYLKSISEDINYLFVSYFNEEKNGNTVDLINVSNQKTILDLPILSQNRIFHPTIEKSSGDIISRVGENLVLIKNLNDEKEITSKKYNFHHSSEFDHDNNIWACATKKENTRSNFVDDYLVKLNKDGDVVFEKSLYECFIDNNLEFIIAPSTSDPSKFSEKYTIDIFHLNDIEPVLNDGKFWNKGDIFVSLRNRSLVFLYRPITNKILWHKTGPWMTQHDVDILDSKRISIFGNDVIDVSSNRNKYHKLHYGHNNIYIYNFENDSISMPYSNVMKKMNVSTYTEGLHRIMNDGKLFLEDQNNHTIYFLNETDYIWKYKYKNKSGRISMFSWSSLYSENEILNLTKFIN